MSLVTLIVSAAALSLDPGLAGPADTAGMQHAVYHHETRSGARTVARTGIRTVVQGGADQDHAPRSTPRTVQLGSDFFHGPLTGGVERPPVQVYWVRQGHVIHAAPQAPASAGQAAAARGLGQP